MMYGYPLGYDFVQVKWGMAVLSMAKLLKTALYSTYAPTMRHHASQPLQNKKEIEWCPSKGYICVGILNLQDAYEHFLSPLIDS